VKIFTFDTPADKTNTKLAREDAIRVISQKTESDYWLFPLFADRTHSKKIDRMHFATPDTYLRKLF